MQEELKTIVENTFSEGDVSARFIKKIEAGGFFKEENPISHLCSYFAAVDLKNKLVFLGHHRKSGKWLFNGGHVDSGETPRDAAKREAKEEWGNHIDVSVPEAPFLLTLTYIDREGQSCKEHYDFWYMIDVGKDEFLPSQEILQEEFYEAGWKSLYQAADLVTDPATIEALEKIQSAFNEV